MSWLSVQAKAIGDWGTRITTIPGSNAAREQRERAQEESNKYRTPALQHFADMMNPNATMGELASQRQTELGGQRDLAQALASARRNAGSMGLAGSAVAQRAGGGLTQQYLTAMAQARQQAMMQRDQRRTQAAGALLGNTPSPVQMAEMYNQQGQNAIGSLTSLLGPVGQFIGQGGKVSLPDWLTRMVKPPSGTTAAPTTQQTTQQGTYGPPGEMPPATFSRASGNAVGVDGSSISLPDWLTSAVKPTSGTASVSPVATSGVGGMGAQSIPQGPQGPLVSGTGGGGGVSLGNPAYASSGGLPSIVGPDIPQGVINMGDGRGLKPFPFMQVPPDAPEEYKRFAKMHGEWLDIPERQFFKGWAGIVAPWDGGPMHVMEGDTARYWDYERDNPRFVKMPTETQPDVSATLPARDPAPVAGELGPPQVPPPEPPAAAKLPVGTAKYRPVGVEKAQGAYNHNLAAALQTSGTATDGEFTAAIDLPALEVMKSGDPQRIEEWRVKMGLHSTDPASWMRLSPVARLSFMENAGMLNSMDITHVASLYNYAMQPERDY